MKLVIDLTGLQSQSRYRGIGRYTRGLAAGLLRTGNDHEIWFAACSNLEESLNAIRDGFKHLIPEDRIATYRVLDKVEHGNRENRWRRMASELVREHFLDSLEADAVLFSSMFEGFNEDIVTTGCANRGDTLRAVVAYDLIPLAAPSDYMGVPEARHWYYEKLAAFTSCDLFLAISNSAGNEVVERLGIDKSRVVSIMGGADEFAAEAGAVLGDWGQLSARLGISCPFFVYTASFEPRKNFETLIAAFAASARGLGRKHQLVLVTSNAAEVATAVRGICQQAGLSARDVILTGHVSDNELKLLYRKCAALVYPSLHEGLGLPILEAMHLDAPAIGSNLSSIPEIIGLEEALFDPRSVEDMTAKITRVASDEEFRNRLKRNAADRRALFSWDRTALHTWHALEQALAARGTAPARASRSRRYHALLAALREISQPQPPSANDLRTLANAIATNLDTISSLRRSTLRSTKRIWRIEGPFDSAYSLALLNRETARALSANREEILLHSTEGPGDYTPNETYLASKHPDILTLWRASSEARTQGGALITSRNLYPPRVNDAEGAYNVLHHYAWEESRFPTQWVDQFNLHLDGITCLSTHVMKVLQDSGVIVPMAVSGCGVDHWERVKSSGSTTFPGKSFRFLHLSSCFPRKGADVMLAAYGKAFRRSDDVTLLIKTFENPHNEIRAQLTAARAVDPEFPDVVLVFDELTDPELKALYQHCHVLVAPSRAEGYGLPMGEAMLSGIPVITTAWSGQLDFCNDETAWLVDFRFAPAKTHFGLSASVWAEPDPDHLAARMLEAYRAPAEERRAKAAAGRRQLMKEHTWSAVVNRHASAVDRWTKPRLRKVPHIGWVSTWNCACGIAEFSKHFVRCLPNRVTVFGADNDKCLGPDESNVVRCWTKNTPQASLSGIGQAADREGIDVLIVQFNYFFFEFSELEKLIVDQKAHGRSVIVTLHSSVDPPVDIWRTLYTTKQLSDLRGALAASDRVLVHSHHDLNRLKSIGVFKNTALFPLGIIDGPEPVFRPSPHSSNFTIGSYGFCLPHKGLRALVSAFAILAEEDPSLSLHLVNAEHPSDVSHQLAAEVGDDLAKLGLGPRARLTSDYLPDDVALLQLRACDLIVFPYEKTGESASAAVRFGIASGRPVVTTELPIFEDVVPAVFQVASSEPAVLAKGLRDIIARLRAGGPDILEKAALSAEWRQEHSYETLAARLSGLTEALHLARPH